MPVEKTDRRVLRTRRQLREALITLILEKGYDTVKVEDITDRADLGRTTFYLHYRDKEELLLDSIEVIADELKARIGINALENSAGNQATIPITERGGAGILMVMRHAAANSTLYRIILNGGAAAHVLNHIRTLLADTARQVIEYRLQQFQPPVVLTVPMDVICAFFASSLLGFITWWLDNALPYTPEEMADYFANIFFNGLRGAVPGGSIGPLTTG